ncbi:MAG: carboxypeptidase-like regulatory domain-containing protein [Gemmatimonadales bacterium]|nr:carboxypeptidase-like regulatory domain-containing protein [Gemmatimonadales bacterium]
MRRTIAVAGVLVVFGMGALCAQVPVRGTVSDRDLRRPVEGALLTFSAPGQSPVRVLSDAGGRYAALLPVAATWAVRVARIGFAPVDAGARAVRDGRPETWDLALEGRPLQLPDLVAASRLRCGGEEGPGAEATLALYDQVRTALLATQVAAAEASSPARTLAYERLVDSLGRARYLRISVGAGQGLETFAQVPVEVLDSAGFIVGDEREGFSVYLPDARTIASDWFPQHFCLESARREATGRAEVGLAFRPPTIAAGRASVEGTLWLDAGTAELRTVEFEYVGPGAFTDVGRWGGAMTYRRVPGGRWVIGDWVVRMPVLKDTVKKEFQRPQRGSNWAAQFEVRGKRTRVLLSVKEDGGYLAELQQADGTRWVHPRLGALEGTIRPGENGVIPAAGVRVAIAGSNYTVQTDSTGHFSFPALPEDLHVLEAAHPAVGALGMLPPRVTAQVRPGQRSAIEWPLDARWLCEGQATPRDTVARGALRVQVAGEDGRPAPGAEVRAEWREGTRAVRQRAQALARGWLTFCGVPADAPVKLAATRQGAKAELETRLPAGAGAIGLAELLLLR